MSHVDPVIRSSSISAFEMTNVIRLLESASLELERDRGAAKASLSAAACILQLNIATTFPTSEGSANDGSKTRLTGWQVARVRAYIDKNLHRAVHARELGEVVNLSVAHFSRAFKAAFGEPPHAYLIRRRIALASHLMLTGAEPLCEIALRAGFSDQAHLSKVFKRMFGESPANWRRERRIAADPGGISSRQG